MYEKMKKAPEYTRRWTRAVNAAKCAVVVCNKDKENPVGLNWK